MKAYQEQKHLTSVFRKIDEIWTILTKHIGERIIIFTNDNALAYDIGREFILPVLTPYRTKERKSMLDAFRAGKLDVLVTSKVLNEGVDAGS